METFKLVLTVIATGVGVFALFIWYVVYRTLKHLRRKERVLWTELILCPSCKSKQFAQVRQRNCDPWPSFIHECAVCKYMIVESEWEKVEP